MGLIGRLAPLYLGCKGECVLMSQTVFEENPMNWLKIVSEWKANLIGGSNWSFEFALNRFLKYSNSSSIDLSDVQYVINFGQPILESTLSKLEVSFKLGNCKFVNCLSFPQSVGIVSASVITTGNKRNYLRVDSSSQIDSEAIFVSESTEKLSPQQSSAVIQLVSVGRPINKTNFHIISTDQMPPLSQQQQKQQKHDEIGEIWLSGSNVAVEIVDDQKAANVKKKRGSKHNWLRTGLFGFLHEEELFVIGKYLKLNGKYILEQRILQLVFDEAANFVRPESFFIFSKKFNSSEELIIVSQLINQSQSQSQSQLQLQQQDLKTISSKIRTSISTNLQVNVRQIVFAKADSFLRTIRYPS